MSLSSRYVVTSGWTIWTECFVNSRWEKRYDRAACNLHVNCTWNDWRYRKMCYWQFQCQTEVIALLRIRHVNWTSTTSLTHIFSSLFFSKQLLNWFYLFFQTGRLKFTRSIVGNIKVAGAPPPLPLVGWYLNWFSRSGTRSDSQARSRHLLSGAPCCCPPPPARALRQ